MRFRCVLVLCTLAVAAAHPARGQETPPPIDEPAVRRQLLAAEAALERAIVAKDGVALDTLLSAEFRWRHLDGSEDTKATWLAFLRDSIEYRAHTAEPTQVTVYQRAAWIAGRLTSRGRYRGAATDYAYTLAYGRLWVQENGHWRVRDQVSRALP